MKEELNKIVTDQQSLQDVLVELQLICQKLDLDFDSALGNAVIDVDETPLCPHSSAFPSASGSIFCPECKSFLVGSGGKVNLAKENLWR
jgi:hypothetical protein